MADRYGNVRVVKIRDAYNDLRKAIRSGDIEAADRALDRYEPWADYVFVNRAAQPPTLAEALRVPKVAETLYLCRRAFGSINQSNGATRAAEAALAAALDAAQEAEPAPMTPVIARGVHEI